MHRPVSVDLLFPGYSAGSREAEPRTGAKWRGLNRADGKKDKPKGDIGEDEQDRWPDSRSGGARGRGAA